MPSSNARTKLLFYFIALITASILIAYVTEGLMRSAKLNQLLRMESTKDRFRALELPFDMLERFREWEAEGEASYYEYMAAYLIFAALQDAKRDKHADLDWAIENLKQHRGEEFAKDISDLMAVWEDLRYFPVPVSEANPREGVSFVDSWMHERSYGGSRGHEGTDIMADRNERGRYPILSMTDGVVENIGWLPKGGYRIGIRAPHGGYFYYAHLHDYAKDFTAGDFVKAGELLGFMGDSGYSEVEGTVGNFPVHLHLGIYVNGPDGKEMSFNPYWPLRTLEERDRDAKE